MRIITLLVGVLLSQIALGAAQRTPPDGRILNERIGEFRTLQNKYKSQCLDNPNRAQMRIVVGRETLNCQQMLSVIMKLTKDLERDVAELRRCEEEFARSQPQQLAGQVMSIATAAAKPQACQKPVEKDIQCFGSFACAASSVATLGASTMLSALAGAATGSNAAKACASSGFGCATSIFRGIFDSLWETAKLIWTGVKWVGGKVRDGVRYALGYHEASTSNKMMAAQQTGDGFLATIRKHGLGAAVRQMARGLWDYLRDAAVNHYGCQKWSGAPFVSTCTQPMATWNCGSCQQKAQVLCGVLGFAGGEIITAAFTGGVFAAGKFAVKGGIRAVRVVGAPARATAATIARNFPRASAPVIAGARTVGQLSGKALTKSQKGAVIAWNGISNNPVTRSIGRAWRATDKRLIGKVALAPLKGIGMYIRAMDKAFVAGMNGTDKLLAGGAKAAAVASKGDDVARAANAANDNEPISELSRVQSAQVEAASRFNDKQRIEAASFALRRRPTQAQQEAILLVNKSNIDETMAIGALEKAGITRAEAQSLMSKGIIAPKPKPIPVTFAQAPNQNVKVNFAGMETAREKQLEAAAKLDDSARLQASSRLLTKVLTPAHRKGILDAHKVGAAQGRGFTTGKNPYTLGDLREKHRILTAAGFSNDEIRKLMDNGYVGNLGDDLPAALGGFASASARELDPAGYLDEVHRLVNTGRSEEVQNFMSPRSYRHEFNNGMMGPRGSRKQSRLIEENNNVMDIESGRGDSLYKLIVSRDVKNGRVSIELVDPDAVNQGPLIKALESLKTIPGVSRRGSGLHIPDVSKVSEADMQKITLVLREIEKPTPSQLAWAAGLDDKNRIRYASSALSRKLVANPLSPEQGQAILRAHKLEAADVQGKTKILSEAGLSPAEVRKLLDEGLVGSKVARGPLAPEPPMPPYKVGGLNLESTSEAVAKMEEQYFLGIERFNDALKANDFEKAKEMHVILTSIRDFADNSQWMSKTRFDYAWEGGKVPGDKLVLDRITARQQNIAAAMPELDARMKGLERVLEKQNIRPLSPETFDNVQNYTNGEILEVGQTIINRDFTPSQMGTLLEIRRAPMVAGQTQAAVVLQKGRRLREAGFSDMEVRNLMVNGFAGKLEPKAMDDAFKTLLADERAANVITSPVLLSVEAQLPKVDEAKELARLSILMKNANFNSVLKGIEEGKRIGATRALLVLGKGRSPNQTVALFQKYADEFSMVRKMAKPGDVSSEAYLATYIARQRAAGIADDVTKGNIGKAFNCK